MTTKVRKDDPRVDLTIWTLIWVINVYDWHPRMSDLDQSALMAWCDDNCHDLWTMHWFQDNLAYCFKDINDAVLFSMVWC